MSEQFKQDSGSNNNELDDDPLAELARIVSGEPESDYTPQLEPDVSQAESASMESDVEAALEEQLMREFTPDAIEPPAFVDEINASVEEIASEQPQTLDAQVDYEQSLQDPIGEAQTETVEQATPEVAFQDDLISALESELTGSSPQEPQQIVEEPEVSVELEQPDEVYAQTEPEVSVEPEVSQEIDPVEAFELETSNIQEALEQEMSAQFELDQEEIKVTEPVEQAGVSASLDADLGAEFANQFQQMNEQAPSVEAYEAPVDVQTDVDVDVQPVAELADNAAVEALSVDDLEADFEAAFAQELEVVTPPASQGWQDNDVTASNEDFAVSAAPYMPKEDLPDMEPVLETVEYDPGHVGSVDDISHVDEQLVAANENGGGKKYAVAALVLALFAGAIAAGYGFLGSDNTTVASGTPEIIKAETDPVKVKPENPGGIVPENQNNASYVDLGGTNTAEVSQDILNSQTEEPLVLNTGPSADEAKSDDRLVPSEDAGSTPNSTASSVLPKVVQTLVVKPDGTILQQPATPKPVETVANTIANAADVATNQVATQVIKKPEPIDGAQATGNLQIPTASPLPKPVVQPKPEPARQVAAAPNPAPAPAPATRKSEWVVQVSSQRSAEAAQQSFNTMRNRFSALQGRAMSIQRANVNGETYFRVRVQTSSRADAGQLCSNIAAAGGSCFVTR